MSKEKNLHKAIKLIKKAIAQKIPVNQICLQEFDGKYRNFVSTEVWKLEERLERGSITQKEYDEFSKIWEEYESVKDSFPSQRTNKKKSKKKIYQKVIDYDDLTDEEKADILYDAENDDNYDERSRGEILREGDEEIEYNGQKVKKITSYHYHIMIKGEPDLIGYLTREEMNMVYRLYSNMDGAGLTIRAVSRQFKHLNYRDFKRILRAFNITKQSIPVAPHVIEEESDEKVMDIIFRNKENNILRKLEDERSKYTEKILKETQKELIELKTKKNEIIENIKAISLEDIVPIRIKKTNIKNKKALIIYISDIHVGAHTPYDSVYENDYDENEVKRRFEIILNKIQEQQKTFGKFESIIVINLGDSLDGFDRQTVRRHHELSQNMGNKEQYNVFVRSMLSFFETLHRMNVSNNIEYYAATNDNHSGSAGYIANKTLEYVFSEKYPDMKVDVFEKFIQHFSCFNHTFILTHGKDGQHKKNGFPLTLDNKTEIYFDEYIRINKIYSPAISVCKGDLHQSATTYGKRFRYKSVPSVYGSSDYIHTNYGNTPAAFEFEIISENNDEILGAKVELN